jgi:uncharacterized RDD family membrane protein YckC
MPHYDLSGLPDPEIDAQFYAGVPFKRLLAWFIDFFIIITLATGVSIATFGIAAIFFPLTLLIINLVYRVYFLKIRSATPGMMITGIEIRNHHGNRLSSDEALWHTVIFTLAMMFVLIQIVSVMMMLFSRHGQGVHDYMRGTTAINRPLP